MNHEPIACRWSDSNTTAEAHRRWARVHRQWAQDSHVPGAGSAARHEAIALWHDEQADAHDATEQAEPAEPSWDDGADDAYDHHRDREANLL